MDKKRYLRGLSQSTAYSDAGRDTLHIPLEAVRIFEAAARHLGFSAAAEELGVTQSAVSQRMRRLETALGVALFRRLPQGLRLTEAGQSYLLDVRPALQRLRAASGRAAIQGARRLGAAERVLAIGTTSSIALLCLAPRLAGFREAFPDVVLSIKTNMALVDPAEAGLDCCLRYGAGDWPGVAVEHLAGEELFPICAPKLIPADSPLLGAADLCALPLVHDLGPVTWVEWLAEFGASPPRQGEALAVTDSALAQRAAVEGIGVALGRSRLAYWALKEGRLIRPVRDAIPSPFSYFLVRPKDRRNDPLIHRFRDWLLAEIFV
ncbi:LysR substrate-binding domain-containing protein [Acidocella sp.]|uniref:LysR substrate-binding domain-containing protein n=1 Tax=Acidocella sp. TaxID=50710 RepID=UPI002F3E56A8